MLGNIQAHFGAFTNPAEDRQCRANPSCAFPHTRDSVMPGLPQMQGALIDSLAIILHSNREPLAAVTEQDVDSPRIRVLQCVRDRLPSNLQNILARNSV